jgi:hypothetical protein
LRKNALLLVLCLILAVPSFSQGPLPGAERREQTARTLSAAKQPKHVFRVFSALGPSKENLFVADASLGDPQKRLEFLNTMDYKALADDGFVAIGMTDSFANTWLARVCIDHFGPMELLMDRGAEVKDPGIALGFSLVITCSELQINKVVPDSAAAKADLRSGDFLVSLNGQKLNTRNDLAALLLMEKAAPAVTLSVRRGGETLSAELSLAAAANFKPKSPWPDAYSRRSYQLGILLSQFRSIPFPDQKDWPGAFPVCTNDPGSHELASIGKLNLPSDWKSAGVVECKFFYNSQAMHSIESAALLLSDWNSDTTFLFISKDGREEPRLFRILSEGPTDSYPSLTLAFISAFGPPSKTSHETYQVKSGGVFPNEVQRWENASSSIEVSQFGETTNLLRVTHILKPLDEVFGKKLLEVAADRAKTL